ncbi:hypothetical protein IW262DRAFT_1462845 [Armillaria fumosa]|nr:hypothetical protein IW262DRAFT_1462845 [Armillaria fumosa]
MATSEERGELGNELNPLPIITLSSTRPSDEEIESVTGLQYPARDSFKYYAGSAGVEDPDTNTNTLPNADGSSIEEPILTRPPTPGPSNLHSLIQHFGPYVLGPDSHVTQDKVIAELSRIRTITLAIPCGNLKVVREALTGEALGN